MALLADVDENLQTLTRHSEYYIPTGDLSFLVEHVQFRVHKYFFDRESRYFAGRLSTPLTPGTPLQGAGDANAIVLEGVTADEFAKFLWVIYNPKYSIYEADTEVWASILSLAHRWGFPEIKNLAVRELEKKEILDVKRIKLYHDNKVDRNYLIPRYAALCEREEMLTFPEANDLGLETTVMITRAREEARASRTASGARSPLTPTIHGADLHEFIRDLFQISAAEADTAGEGTYNTGALVAQLSSSSSGLPSLTVSVVAVPETSTNGGANGHLGDADADPEDTSSNSHAEGDPFQAGGGSTGGKGNNNNKKGKGGATTDKGDPQTGDSGAGDETVPDTPSGKGGKNNNRGGKRGGRNS